jgi:predicted Zn-dependent protease
MIRTIDHSFARLMPPARIALTAALALLPALLAGCATTTAGGAVGADRPQLLLISSAKMDQMAAQAYNTLKSDSITKGDLNTDPAMLARVRAIAARLEPQTGVFRKDALHWKWEVNVISSSTLNAFCMPGGKIMVYSGLVTRLHLTDDEIAVVMGHEIAHALREHAREQVSQAIAAQTAIDLGGALLGLGAGASDMATLSYQNFIATKFSRTDESEADRIGLELAARAGYDPRAGVTLWRKMMAASQGQGKPPEFLSTHPANENRIKDIESLLPTVMPLYEAARRQERTP